MHVLKIFIFNKKKNTLKILSRLVYLLTAVVVVAAVVVVVGVAAVGAVSTTLASPYHGLKQRQNSEVSTQSS